MSKSSDGSTPYCEGGQEKSTRLKGKDSPKHEDICSNRRPDSRYDVCDSGACVPVRKDICPGVTLLSVCAFSTDRRQFRRVFAELAAFFVDDRYRFFDSGLLTICREASPNSMVSSGVKMPYEHLLGDTE